MELSKSTITSRLAAESIIYLLIGCGHVFWGVRFATTPELGVNLALLIAIQFLCYLGGVLLTPYLEKLVELHRHIPLMCMVFCLSTFVGASFDSLVPLLFASIGLGIIAGLQETVIAAGILSDRNRANAIVLLEMFFGIGALAFPLVVAVVKFDDHFYPYALLISFLALLASVLWHHGQSTTNPVPDTSITTPRQRHQHNNRGGFNLLLLTLMLVIFIYGGFETNFANWLPSFGQHNSAGQLGEMAISLFWIGIVCGRLVIHKLHIDVGQTWLLLLSGIVIVSMILLLGLSISVLPHPFLYLMVFLVGFSSSAVFPGLLAFAVLRVKYNPTMIISRLVAAVSLGGSICALPVGYIMTHFTDQALLFSLAAIGTLILFGGALAIKSTTPPVQ